MWRKTVQNELFLQAVHTCTPWRNSILLRKTAQMSLGLAPLPPSSMLYVLYVLYLTRQATEHPLSPSSLLYVLYVLYTLYARNLYYMCYIGAI